MRFVAVLFFSMLWALEPSSRESHLDLIDKAQNLTLQHDRLQATQILARALRSEKPGSSAYTLLERSLNNLSGLFYTEKAQKSYELALSSAEPHAAIDKFNEALGLEPGNTTILLSLARARIRAQECHEALHTADMALEIHPFLGEAHLARIQALQCLHENQKAHALLISRQESLKGFNPAFEAAAIRDLMAHKRWFEAKRRAKELQTSLSAYPESLGFLFRISQELKAPDLDAAERYVELCRKGAEALRKKFEIEPNVCLSSKDVENELRTLRHLEDGTL